MIVLTGEAVLWVTAAWAHPVGRGAVAPVPACCVWWHPGLEGPVPFPGPTGARGSGSGPAPFEPNSCSVKRVRTRRLQSVVAVGTVAAAGPSQAPGWVRAGLRGGCCRGWRVGPAWPRVLAAGRPLTLPGRDPGRDPGRPQFGGVGFSFCPACAQGSQASLGVLALQWVSPAPLVSLALGL